MHDVRIVAGFGVVGYLLRMADVPMAPLALLLGRLVQNSFRQTLIAEQGNVPAIVERPLSGAYIAISVIFFAVPLLKYEKGARRTHDKPAEQAGHFREPRD